MATTPISFNPTAKAVIAEVDNIEEVRDLLTEWSGVIYRPAIDAGFAYVVFLGHVYKMTQDQLQAVQGFA